MSNHPTCQGLRNVTFSQALEAGLTHLGSLVGQTTNQSGLEVALASHSVKPEMAQDLTTRGTFGPLFAGSSPSADLQQFLESKLRATLVESGSMEYALTWKQWDMLSGVPICALRASALPTEDSACGGWRTPTHGDGVRGIHTKASKRQGDYALTNQALLTGWPTPLSRDHKSDLPPEKRKSGKPLSSVALLTKKEESKVKTSTMQKKGMAHYCGMKASGIDAETENRGELRLNPGFSLWLMGYPDEWLYSGVQAMQSSRKSRKSS